MMEEARPCNVVGLRGALPSAARQEPDAALIEMLESYLQRARDGEITAAAIACATPRGAHWNSAVVDQGDANAVLAALQYVSLELTRRVVDQD